MMIITRHFLFIILSIVAVLSSCSSYKLKKEMERKAAAEVLRPQWTKSEKNMNNGYFWGVGQSLKKINTIGEVNHTEKCKKEALTQIANTISVEIDAQTMLATTSISNAMRQDFQQTIKLTSQIDLEGVQLSDSYEDEFAVFTRYKLSIADYQTQKQRKIADVAQKSCELMTQAFNFRQQNDYRNALIFYLKAMAVCSNYWKENLQTNCNKSTFNPLVEIDKQLRETLQLLSLQPIETSVDIPTGSNLSPAFAGFITQSDKGQPVNNIPLKFQADGLVLPMVNGVTQNGQYTFNFRSVPSHAKTSTITATLDIATIIQEAALSEQMGTFARRYTLPVAEFKITRSLPKIHFYSDNQLLSMLTTDELKQQMSKKEVEEGTKNNSVTTVEILTVKNELTQQSNYYTQSAIVRLTWIDKNKKRVEESIAVTESALSEREVSVKVNTAIVKEIKGKVTEEIYFSLF